MPCRPDDSKGGQNSILRFDFSSGSCDGPVGGTRTAGTPVFVPVVVNALDLIWRTEEFVAIQSDEDDTLIVFDNI